MVQSSAVLICCVLEQDTICIVSVNSAEMSAKLENPHQGYLLKAMSSLAKIAFKNECIYLNSSLCESKTMK